MRESLRGAGLAWAGSILAVVCGIIGLVYLVVGGLDYPAFATASWFVTLAIVMALLLVVAFLWNIWAVLSRIFRQGPAGPLMEPAWLGAFIAAALTVSLGIVIARIPSLGLGAYHVCPRGNRCYLNYGSSRTELMVAAALFLADAVLFAAVGVWATVTTGHDRDREE